MNKESCIEIIRYHTSMSREYFKDKIDSENPEWSELYKTTVESLDNALKYLEVNLK
jgi:hypothetical protein